MRLTLQRDENNELCLHADGNPLPAQLSVSVVQEPHSPTTIIVKFLSDPGFEDNSVTIMGDE